MIRRSRDGTLRNEVPPGRKAMLVWDKACIDYRLWFDLKHTHGVYFITLEKKNSAAETCSQNLVDRSDLRNEGVSQVTWWARRIVYKNPKDGEVHTHLTNDMTLPPGISPFFISIDEKLSLELGNYPCA